MAISTRFEKRKKEVEVEKIPAEFIKPGFKDIWFDLFGTDPASNIGNFEGVRKALNTHFRKVVDLWIQQFELKSAGMGQIATNMAAKIRLETNNVVENFEEFLGYKKLPVGIEKILKTKAEKASKFLNVYTLSQYHSLPPKEVVTAIQCAKPYFPTMEIWAIEDKEFLKDPVVVGKKYDSRVKGYYVYFFIASWGNDIKVEDLFKDKRKK